MGDKENHKRKGGSFAVDEDGNKTCTRPATRLPTAAENRKRKQKRVADAKAAAEKAAAEKAAAKKGTGSNPKPAKGAK